MIFQKIQELRPSELGKSKTHLSCGFQLSFFNYYCKGKHTFGQNQTNRNMSIHVIRNSNIRDLKSTLDLFVKVTDWMLGHGIDQWNYDYPNEETIRQDIASGNHFVITENKTVIGTILLDSIQDEQYRSIHWNTKNKDVMVIHRLGVLPQSQGQGIATSLCKFAEVYGRNNGYKTIRLDAYAGNLISNGLYEKLGYQRANGYCYFRKKAIPFYCYDKKLQKLKI